MIPKIFAVVPFGDDIYMSGETFLGGQSVMVRDPHKDHISFFSSRNTAEHFAKQAASFNGGRTYLVLETTNMFLAQAQPPVQKVWKNGELVPV